LYVRVLCLRAVAFHALILGTALLLDRVLGGLHVLAQIVPVVHRVLAHLLGLLGSVRVFMRELFGLFFDLVEDPHKFPRCFLWICASVPAAQAASRSGISATYRFR